MPLEPAAAPAIGLLFIAGLLAGVLVNILADDLPHYRRPRLPRYPDGAPRPFIAWSGLSAFLTGRRASPGGARLSWRWPLAELATAALLIIAYLATANDPAVTGVQRLFYFVYMALFVLITVIDLEHRLILFAVIIPSCALALLAAILTPASRPTLGEALGGAALGFGVFFLLYLGGILFSHVVAKARGQALPEVAFGYGDVLLATLCGLILGWQALIFAMFITVFLGALGALVYLIVRSLSGRYDMFTPLPYGPYIIIGTWIMLLFSDQVRALLWRL